MAGNERKILPANALVGDTGLTAWQVKRNCVFKNLRFLDDWQQAFITSIVEKKIETPTPKQYAKVDQLWNGLIRRRERDFWKSVAEDPLLSRPRRRRYYGPPVEDDEDDSGMNPEEW